MHLCKGDLRNKEGKQLSYLNSKINRFHKDFFMTGGNIDMEHGESIYGKIFEDENKSIRHDKPGILGMCNTGKNTNGSQFYITLQKIPYFD